MANLRANNLTGTGGRNAIDGSVFFDGGESLGIPSIALGSGDWTIEFWFYSTKEGSQDGHIYDGRGTGSASSAYPIIKFDTDEKLSFYTTGAIRIQGASVVELGSWNHVALVKNSSTTTLYLNGQSEGTYSDSNTYLAPSNSIGRIGSDDNGSAYYFYGFLSNYRFVKGTAVYTANFTPPTEKLTAIDGTVLLCCQDSDNALQEATGKTITGYGIHPSEAYDGNGEGPELVTSTGVWTLACGGGSCSNFTVTNNGQKLSGTTVTSGYIRATYTGLNAGSKYRIKVTLTAGSNNNFAVQGLSADTGYVPATDGTAGTALQVGPSYVFEWSGSTQVQLTGSAWNTLYTFDDVSIKQIPNDGSPKVLPPVGVDEGVVFDGDIKINSPGVMYFPTGDTSQRGRGRGVIFGGYSSPSGYMIDIYYLEIQSMGNAVHFGDLTSSRYSSGGCASATRGLSGGGRDSGGNRLNTIEYVTIATTSNSLDFGDLTEAKSHCAGCGNQTRGIWMGGTLASGVSDVIEYATIANTGNATDFGNLRAASTSIAVTSSPTRALAMGGDDNSSSFFDYIDYVEIATTGNAQDFGDLTQDRNQNTAVSSNTRAICIGGNRSPAISNVMDYVTIATLGDATDFGDTVAPYEHTGSVDNSIRGVITGARTPSYINILESLTIATTGNSTDFGDIPRDNLAYVAGTSDSHGGLS